MVALKCCQTMPNGFVQVMFALAQCKSQRAAKRNQTLQGLQTVTRPACNAIGLPYVAGSQTMQVFAAMELVTSQVCTES